MRLNTDEANLVNCFLYDLNFFKNAIFTGATKNENVAREVTKFFKLGYY